MMRRLSANPIQALQRQWGSQVVYRYGDRPTPLPRLVIPTGYAELDQRLGIGGIPQQAITELVGRPTSGMTSLALQLARQAQNLAYPVVYADLAYHFDAN